MTEDSDYEVAPAGELRRKYGLTAENRPTIHLDPSLVPSQFRVWIPLAERWGISDDLIREDCVVEASDSELSDLLAFGDAYDAVLTNWLAGPESRSSTPSPEYVAFTCLGMALDFAQLSKQKNEK